VLQGEGSLRAVGGLEGDVLVLERRTPAGKGWIVVNKVRDGGREVGRRRLRPGGRVAAAPRLPRRGAAAGEAVPRTLRLERRRSCTSCRTRRGMAEPSATISGRASGILLHPTSLPGPGIGDLGAPAEAFVGWLHDAGQRLWQVLPLVAVDDGGSPYNGLSAFAGNPLLLSAARLADEGLLTPADLAPPPLPEDRVDFPAVAAWKGALLRRATEAFHARRAPALAGGVRRLSRGERRLAGRLRALPRHPRPGGGPRVDGVAGAAPPPRPGRRWRGRGRRWRRWRSATPSGSSSSTASGAPCGRARTTPGSASSATCPSSSRTTAPTCGPTPISSTWTRAGLPTAVSGVPPDYFSATGQRWGNPLYRWDVMARDGYTWWRERFRRTLEMVDVARIDHFRGFEAYWEVPAEEPTALNGRWVAGPGRRLFDALEESLGRLPLIAEDLGLITPEVEALRDDLGLPGMRVLQFAFGGGDPANPHLPRNHVRNAVAYPGTHDNDTAVGWWTEGATDEDRSGLRVLAPRVDDDPAWAMMEVVLNSAADWAVIPLQDVLSLGSGARMNTPGRMEGNWGWRFREGALTPELAARLRRLVEASGRLTVG
jgi:4-alpha-glucanotransferase